MNQTFSNFFKIHFNINKRCFNTLLQIIHQIKFKMVNCVNICFRNYETVFGYIFGENYDND